MASAVTAQRLQRSAQRLPPQHQPASLPPHPANFKVAAAASCSNFVSDVVQRCGPAVVKVLTEHTRDDEEGDLSELIESLFGGGSGEDDGHPDDDGDDGDGDAPWSWRL